MGVGGAAGQPGYDYGASALRTEGTLGTGVEQQETLLLRAILAELRLQTFMMAEAFGIKDDLSALRTDAALIDEASQL